MTEHNSVQDLRAHAATWISDNPVLLSGQHGYEKDTGKFKIGNGRDRWTEIEYFLPEDAIQELVAGLIQDNPGGGGGGDNSSLIAHINSSTPHPVYDDGPEFILYYQNAKV